MELSPLQPLERNSATSAFAAFTKDTIKSREAKKCFTINYKLYFQYISRLRFANRDKIAWLRIGRGPFSNASPFQPYYYSDLPL